MKTWLFLCLFSCFGTSMASQNDAYSPSNPRDIDAMLRAQLLAQKTRDGLQKKFEQLREDQQQTQSEQAVEEFQESQRLFQKEKYQDARKKLVSAMRLDPREDKYFYAYAICLYKLGDYRRSLAFLNILEASSINPVELNYYAGLNHLHLKEDDLAYNKFVETQNERDVSLSSMAAMYAGFLARKKEEFSQARGHYEFVLDYSKNPKLDQKAENAIVLLNQLEMEREQSKKKWGYSIFTGVVYDENVLNISQINQATSLKAYRGLYGASVAYRAYYSAKRSFAPQLTFSDMYSLDEDFKSNATVQSTDPMLVNLTLPFRTQFKIGKKITSLLLSPYYQHLYMSINESGRELVFDSKGLTTSLSLQHHPKWVSDYRLDVSHDNSHLINASPLDDQTALRYTVGTTQTRLLDSSGTKTLSFDLLYVFNDAEGANNLYQKYLLAVGGSRALSDKWLSYARLDYMNMNFKDSVLNREDKGITGTLGAVYSFTAKTAINMNLQYLDNQSSVSAYEFDKIVFSAILSYRGGIF